MEALDVEKYLSEGLHKLVRNIIKATFTNPKESAFFAKYALSNKKAASRRHELETQGEHIPSFLIASITEECNLSCAGCYDRANRTGKGGMLREDWRSVFAQAEEMGVSAILLAGGEPLIRPDIIEEAASFPGLLFPVFTNGTMMTGENYQYFDTYRNLIPIISIEGNKEQTDTRRGDGVFDQTAQCMAKLKAGGLLFGTSITVNTENILTVTADDYIAELKSKGCGAVIFVEYVPVDQGELALSDEERDLLADRVAALRQKDNMIILSFPGDERTSGGCLAAGRGFFHIGASGGATPCPFSPYSDTNLMNTSLREALRSPLFSHLREDGYLFKEHVGGCALFAQAEEIQSLLEK